MGGHNIIATIIVSLTLIGFAWLIARVWTRIVLPEIRRPEIFGDVVEVPPELRPARKAARGDVVRASGRADTHTVIAHDNVADR